MFHVANDQIKLVLVLILFTINVRLIFIKMMLTRAFGHVKNCPVINQGNTFWASLQILNTGLALIS